MKKLLYFLFSFIVLFSIPVFSAPLSDLPDKNHWAYDALNLLQEKNLVEGYPDGTFKGDRTMTRYEMAMAVARIIAKIKELEASIPGNPDLSPYATKEDLELIKKLISEYDIELKGLGVRISNIEKTITSLSGRVGEIERVVVSGDITVVGTGMGFGKEPVNTNPEDKLIVFEDYSGYPLTHGFAMTSRINLDLGFHVNDHMFAGGTFTAYSAFGDPQVAYSWGVIPPYNPTGYNINKIYNNGFNYQAGLSKVWFNTKGDWEVNGTFGEFYPEKISNLLYCGVVTPIYWAPLTYPLYGINLNGTLYGNYKFEFLQANDIIWGDFAAAPVWNPDRNNPNPYDLYSSGYYVNPQGYHSRMYGFLGGYEKDKLSFDVTYMRIFEDRASRPESTLPARDEVLLGIRGSYKLMEDKVKLFGEYAQSWFGYDLRTVQERKSGKALIMGGQGKWSDFDYNGQFITIDGNYEPFNLHKIFNYTSEDMYTPSIYRPNRIGFNTALGYNFNEKGRVYGSISYFKQIEPTLDTNPETTIGSLWGFQDHAFTRSSNDKGREFYFDLGANYKVTDNFKLEGHFYSFNFKRTYTGYEHDQTRKMLHLAGTYNITEKFSATGLYDMVKINGINDLNLNTDSLLHIPGVSLKYNFSGDTILGITYRHYNNDDKLNDSSGYKVNRLSTWMTLKF
jgi:hypothetical protein